MTHHSHYQKQTILDKVIDAVLAQPWRDILTDLWKWGRRQLQERLPRGPYEVLEYESTLELLDPEGRRAVFRKREKIRYLQDNIIAYQDQAWGDGEILVNYRCTPGKPVDCYRTGHKWHMLISRREVRSRGDIDEFNIEWEIHDGFLKPMGYWETHITHPTERLAISVMFPAQRHPTEAILSESRLRRSCAMDRRHQTLLPDGRLLVRFAPSRLHRHLNYILQWKW